MAHIIKVDDYNIGGKSGEAIRFLNGQTIDGAVSDGDLCRFNESDSTWYQTIATGYDDCEGTLGFCTSIATGRVHLLGPIGFAGVKGRTYYVSPFVAGGIVDNTVINTFTDGMIMRVLGTAESNSILNVEISEVLLEVGESTTSNKGYIEVIDYIPTTEQQRVLDRLCDETDINEVDHTTYIQQAIDDARTAKKNLRFTAGKYVCKTFLDFSDLTYTVVEGAKSELVCHADNAINFHVDWNWKGNGGDDPSLIKAFNCVSVTFENLVFDNNYQNIHEKNFQDFVRVRNGSQVVFDKCWFKNVKGTSRMEDSIYSGFVNCELGPSSWGCEEVQWIYDRQHTVGAIDDFHVEATSRSGWTERQYRLEVSYKGTTSGTDPDQYTWKWRDTFIKTVTTLRLGTGGKIRVTVPGHTLADGDLCYLGAGAYKSQNPNGATVSLLSGDSFDLNIDYIEDLDFDSAQNPYAAGNHSMWVKYRPTTWTDGDTIGTDLQISDGTDIPNFCNYDDNQAPGPVTGYEVKHEGGEYAGYDTNSSRGYLNVYWDSDIGHEVGDTWEFVWLETMTAPFYILAYEDAYPWNKNRNNFVKDCTILENAHDSGGWRIGQQKNITMTGCTGIQGDHYEVNGGLIANNFSNNILEHFRELISCRNLIIRDNIVDGCTGPALNIYDVRDWYPVKSENILVENNIFLNLCKAPNNDGVGKTSGITVHGGTHATLSGIDGLVIRNNTIGGDNCTYCYGMTHGLSFVGSNLDQFSIEIKDNKISDYTQGISTGFLSNGIQVRPESFPVEGIISVKHELFGAKGDGYIDPNSPTTAATGTDDTTAIQACIDYVESKGGGTVYFPRGIYLVSSTLRVRHPNIQLLGCGAVNSQPSYKLHDPNTFNSNSMIVWIGTDSVNPGASHINRDVDLDSIVLLVCPDFDTGNYTTLNGTTITLLNQAGFNGNTSSGGVARDTSVLHWNDGAHVYEKDRCHIDDPSDANHGRVYQCIKVGGITPAENKSYYPPYDYPAAWTDVTDTSIAEKALWPPAVSGFKMQGLHVMGGAHPTGAWANRLCAKNASRCIQLIDAPRHLVTDCQFSHATDTAVQLCGKRPVASVGLSTWATAFRRVWINNVDSVGMGVRINEYLTLAELAQGYISDNFENSQWEEVYIHYGFNENKYMQAEDWPFYSSNEYNWTQDWFEMLEAERLAGRVLNENNPIAGMFLCGSDHVRYDWLTVTSWSGTAEHELGALTIPGVTPSAYAGHGTGIDACSFRKPGAQITCLGSNITVPTRDPSETFTYDTRTGPTKERLGIRIYEWDMGNGEDFYPTTHPDCVHIQFDSMTDNQERGMRLGSTLHACNSGITGTEQIVGWQETKSVKAFKRNEWGNDYLQADDLTLPAPFTLGALNVTFDLTDLYDGTLTGTYTTDDVGIVSVETLSFAKDTFPALTVTMIGRWHTTDANSYHSCQFTIHPVFDMSSWHNGIMVLEAWMSGANPIEFKGDNACYNSRYDKDAYDATLIIKQNATGTGVWPGWETATSNKLVWLTTEPTWGSLTANQGVRLKISYSATLDKYLIEPSAVVAM